MPGSCRDVNNPPHRATSPNSPEALSAGSKRPQIACKVYHAPNKAHNSRTCKPPACMTVMGCAAPCTGSCNRSFHSQALSETINNNIGHLPHTAQYYLKALAEFNPKLRCAQQKACKQRAGACDSKGLQEERPPSTTALNTTEHIVAPTEKQPLAVNALPLHR